MRENGMYAREVAKELIDAKRGDMKNGQAGKDVLSLLSGYFLGCWRFANRRLTRFFQKSRGAGMPTVN